MSKSIMQSEKCSYLNGDTRNLHKHHIYAGCNRKNSEKYGFWVWLTPEQHNMSNDGVHFNRDLDLALKSACQEEFEKTHSRAEFMRIIGKNYLDGGD